MTISLTISAHTLRHNPKFNKAKVSFKNRISNKVQNELKYRTHSPQITNIRKLYKKTSISLHFKIFNILRYYITFNIHLIKYRNKLTIMNKLQLFAATAVIGFSACACNTKPSKVNSANNTSTEKTVPASVKTFDNELIMQAALDGKIETVKDALNKGFNANTIDPNKRTSLMLAAYNGHNEIVKLLIANGADVNLTDNVDRTALMYASTGSSVPTVISLLESGSKPNMIDNEENWTAGMMAASEGQLEVLKVLVSHGADLKMLDIDGESSLDFANSNGHPAVANYIKTQLK